MTERLTVKALQAELGVTPDGLFGPRSSDALSARLSNLKAPGLTDVDFTTAAARLGVPVGHIRGVRRVEAPRGPFDNFGRPSILFERHKFRAATVPPGRFDRVDPGLSGPPYGKGGYGAFSAQYGKLFAACALDPHAAFEACSWGAFQVMGGWAAKLGYGTAWGLAKALTTGEAAHLETFCRYVEKFGLVDELRACRPNDPDSCRPFVQGYNGVGYRQFNYHLKFAAAIA